jgi:hypothetical protein
MIREKQVAAQRASKRPSKRNTADARFETSTTE